MITNTQKLTFEQMFENKSCATVAQLFENIPANFKLDTLFENDLAHSGYKEDYQGVMSKVPLLFRAYIPSPVGKSNTFTIEKTVGDIHSNEKGSGARYNAGKPDMSLIPLCYLVDIFRPVETLRVQPDFAVLSTGKFQMGGTKEDLLEALQSLSGYVEECARVFEYGKKKYAAWNWAKGMAWSIPIACIGRHYLKIIEGEAADAESGLAHEAHMMCNIVMLLWYIDNYPEGDDRYLPATYRAEPIVDIV